MNNKFVILDGTLYIEKDLFRDSLLTENNLSFLVGDCNSNMFRTKPKIRTGIESVTIDYRQADELTISKNLDSFIDDITTTYPYDVRGTLIVLTNNEVVDVQLSQY